VILKKTAQRKAGLLIVTTAAYVLIFFILNNFFLRQIAILAVIPVIAAGLLYGFRGGFLAGILVFPLNILLYLATSNDDFVTVLHMLSTGGRILGQIGEILIGSVVGRMHDVSETAAQTLRKYEEAEIKLNALNANLENIINTRTAELIKANEDLHAEITGRKQVEEALRESEKRYRLLFEGNRDGVVLVDGKGGFLDANRAFCDMLGYSLEELKEMKDFNSTISVRLKEREHEEIWNNRLLKQGYTGIYEKEYIHKDGSVFPVELQAFAIFNEHRELLYIWGVVRNITERKQAEAEIVRLVTAIDQTRETIEVINPDGVVQYVNKAVEHFNGKTCSEIIGKNIFDNKQFIDQLRQAWKIVSEGKIWTGVRTLQLNGIAYEFEFTLTPVFDARGTLTSIISMGRDVTHEKKLEEQLLQSQKMQAIGTLAGGIAHDFNNILAGMLGFIEIAKDEVPQDSQLRHYFDQTLKLGDRAVNLVRQILVFSRKSDSNRSPMQISPLIKEVLNMLRATLPATIEVRQKLLDQGSLVEADPTQIHQVVMNLCTNAYHAMQEKAGVLEVELTRISVSPEDIVSGQDIEPGPHVLLKVSDTGEGIKPEVISRIFDPFFTTKDVGKGTGLGLSVVHGIIKNHRVDITVTSEPGRGTTFSILLPETVSAQSEIIQAADNNTPLSGSEHILFVDDEESLTGLARKLLEPLGYTVTAVQSSREALALFQKAPEQFDLVITDLSMPHMSGYELGQKIIALKPGMPVILCTGYNETILDNKEKEQGIKEVLTKPFNKKVLAETLRRVLDTTV